LSNSEADIPLFRESDVDAFTKRSYGRPIVSMPRSWVYLMIMLVGLTAITIWFLSSSNYARKEKAFGWLTPDTGLARISVLQTGTIEKINFT